MKRSEINANIRWAEALLNEYQFPLPRFAKWDMHTWRLNKANCAHIFKVMQGWDITDFGSGDFLNTGAVLFTLRNGKPDEPGIGSPYAEKLILTREGQCLPCHYHASKTEDIINRGGGKLFMKLYNKLPDGGVDRETPVTVYSDGIPMTVEAGAEFLVNPGDSVRLTPFTYHIFGAKRGYGDLIAGEVSAINDDNTDNFFAEPTARFAAIEEDEPILRPLVTDYALLMRED